MIGLVAAVWMIHLMPDAIATDLAVPVFKSLLIPFGFLFPFVALFVLMGSANAVNFTDGLDGLATVPTMIAAAVFALIAYLVGNKIFAGYLEVNFIPGVGELAVFLSALIGAGLGFLWFNAPPAAVFMGDTGSLSLGGALGAVAVATKNEIVLAIVGGLFVVETISVIVQVFWYKRTGQARVPDGAAAPSFREERLGGTDHRHPLLDHLDDPGAGGAGHPENPMSVFSGQRFAVLGLGRAGLPAALRLREFGAEVFVWDDNAASREAASGFAVPSSRRK